MLSFNKVLESLFRFLSCRRFYIWEVDRATEFSPLKNGPGAGKDCPETCRKSILDMHASWAKSAGAIFENEERDVLEISPLVSIKGEVSIFECIHCGILHWRNNCWVLVKSPNFNQSWFEPTTYWKLTYSVEIILAAFRIEGNYRLLDVLPTHIK